MEKIDLHMHSHHSDDADLPVDDLIARCRANGIGVLAVTDHNSAASVPEAARHHGNGLTVISGIEIDCTFEGTNFHLLGYGYTPGDDFARVHRNFNALQASLVPEKLAKLRALGFLLDEDELARLAGDRLPQEEQMGETVLNDDRNRDHVLLLPYRSGGARADMPLINFYWDFFGRGKPCYVPVTYPAMSEMIALIRDHGGLPVVAHIGANIKDDYERTLGAMLGAGVAGIEVFSSYHAPELTQRLYDFAASRNAHVTCGSDFHGRNKPKIEVGQCSYSASQYAAVRRFVDVVA